MDTAQWHQEIVLKPMEEMIVPNTNNSTTCSSKPCVERKIRPQKDQALNCPRCNSTNTKFCYYNNYSLSQPRYFCKTCRRYWTEGGSLRSIPVGGGSRKNKRSSSSSSTTSCSSTSSNININPLKNLPDLVLHQNPSTKIHDHHQDLNLGFSSDFKTISELIQVPNYDNNNNNKDNNNNSTSTMSSLELITGMTTRGLSNNNNINSFMPMPIISDHPNSVYNTSHGFSMPHEFKPSLSFSLDHGLGPGGGAYHHLQDTTTSSRLLFNFDGLKQVSSTTTTTTTTDHHGVDHHQHNRDQPSGFWNGMLGSGGERGGGSW